MRWIGVAYVQLATRCNNGWCCWLRILLQILGFESRSLGCLGLGGLVNLGIAHANLALQKCSRPATLGQQPQRPLSLFLALQHRRACICIHPNAQISEEGLPVSQPRKLQERKGNSTTECHDSSHVESHFKPDTEVNIGRMRCSQQQILQK